MGYYPIKCVHCMRSLRMEDRCVRLVRENVESFGDRFGEPEIEFSDEVELRSESGAAGQASREIRYKSLAQLRRESVIEREEIQKIEISPEYQSIEECKKDFVQSIVVKDLDIGDRKVSGNIRKFYCPYCHNEIYPLAGKMPMYLVSLLGPTSAGKTVYMTILHMVLNGRTYRLPQGRLSFVNLGETGTEFDKYAQKIRRNNELPATTQEKFKDPYLLQVSYSAYPETGMVNKQCLLGLIDMRGEVLGGEHNDELSRYNLPQFKESDGFIMLVDPETLEGVYNRLPEQYFHGRRIEDLEQLLRSMQKAIRECITAEMGKIRRPSVVAMAKQDILQKNYSQLGLSLNDPVIAPNFYPVPNSDLGRTYFGFMDSSTMNCILNLSGGFADFLNNTFFKENTYFMSLSALGSYVQVRGNRIDNAEKIRPVRVEEPVVRLLMDFNFIPRFYHRNFFSDPGFVMQRYGELFAEMWKKPVEEEENGKRKGRKR